MTADAQPDVPVGNHFDKYHAGNPIERRMMSGFLGALDSLVASLDPTSILEVGVGEGEILERMRARFPGAVTKGLDLPDEHLLEHWRRRQLDAEFGDATALPYADASFDLVLAIEVLEHIERPERALAELQRVCAGHVVLSVPREPIWRIGNLARGRYVRALGNTPGHVNHWSARTFTRFVDTAFAVDARRQPVPWTMVRAAPRRPTRTT